MFVHSDCLDGRRGGEVKVMHSVKNTGWVRTEKDLA